MNIINLTPHEIKFVDKENEVYKTIPSSGQARARQKDKQVDKIEWIPVYKTEYWELYYKEEEKEQEIPEEQQDTIYIVSIISCQAALTREDFYIVNNLVRDENGNIIGARWLSQNPYA